LNKLNGPLHIISHTDLDGVTAAALAWRVHHGRGIPIKVSLTGYGEVDNIILETRRGGGGAIVLDLSPQFQATVDEIDALFNPDDPPFLFDHHKSASEKFFNRPWAVLDTSCCGAAVYWNWIHSGNADDEALGRAEPMREMVRIANDRDLWINEDPMGRLWQAMTTLCGEWGAFARLIVNPDAAFTGAEREAAENFVALQEARFEAAKHSLIISRIGVPDGLGEMAFLGDGHLEFGDTSDFCGLILDRPEEGKIAPVLAALAYKRPGGGWAVSLRSRDGLSGKVVSLLKDGRRVRGGGHGDAASLYFPSNYDENSIRDSILAALTAQNERTTGMGVVLGDLLKGAL
jgi:hypothetical protein